MTSMIRIPFEGTELLPIDGIPSDSPLHGTEAIVFTTVCRGRAHVSSVESQIESALSVAEADGFAHYVQSDATIEGRVYREARYSLAFARRRGDFNRMYGANA